MLRDYQQRAIDQLYQWFESGHDGNPCIVMPTGSGKSWVIAELCRDAIQSWPETHILMLTHQKELIEQDMEKLLLIWPGAPAGVFSASIERRELGNPITFAGIQSVRKRAKEIGHIDIIIIDEAHCISHKDEGGYRKVINELQAINPALRVVGLTATPYRLGHGLITDDPAIFSDLIDPVTIEELVHKGYLAPLRSKVTEIKLETDGVKKRGGEFIDSDLQKAVNRPEKNMPIVKEIIKYAGDRKSWLIFCAGIEHAQTICENLNDFEIKAACVTGKTPKKERERLLSEFQSGDIKAITNANVLTTGFDYPDIDLIAMLRPTMSPGLYVQMAGRGLRPKSHTDHCLVLDFASNVVRHGPITAVEPPAKKTGKGQGEAPVKVCDDCFEIVHAAVKSCPACGFLFPEPERSELSLSNADIMGLGGVEMEVSEWSWRPYISRTSGKAMILTIYYGSISDPPINEYLPVTHDGYAGQKAVAKMSQIARNAGVEFNFNTIEDTCDAFNMAKHPKTIKYKKDGKFYRILERKW